MLLSVRRGHQAGGQARQAWSTTGRRRSRAVSPRTSGSCGGGAFSRGFARAGPMTRSQAHERLTAERPSGWGGLKKFRAQGSAQAFEKARFGQENQRKSKGFSVADPMFRPRRSRQNAARLAPGPLFVRRLRLAASRFSTGRGSHRLFLASAWARNRPPWRKPPASMPWPTPSDRCHWAGIEAPASASAAMNIASNGMSGS